MSEVEKATQATGSKAAVSSHAGVKRRDEAAPAKGLYSRLQVAIILVLLALLAAGLFVFKHRRRLNAEPIAVTKGDPDDYAFRVDVNTASWEVIALLPGIGETKAKAIIEYREKNGPFKTAEDLTHVSGIGEKTIKQISPYMAFE